MEMHYFDDQGQPGHGGSHHIVDHLTRIEAQLRPEGEERTLVLQVHRR